jgi:hypothetical protein
MGRRSCGGGADELLNCRFVAGARSIHKPNGDAMNPRLFRTMLVRSRAERAA